MSTTKIVCICGNDCLAEHIVQCIKPLELA